MASTNESGHVKNMNHFENLIKVCTEFGSAYNPSKGAIQIANLNQLLTDAKAEINNVNLKLINYNTTIHSRQMKFENLRKIATRIIYALELTDATPMTIENAKSLKKKILVFELVKWLRHRHQQKGQPNQRKRQTPLPKLPLVSWWTTSQK